MKFRRKLLLIFAFTVFVSVATVAWITSALARKAFAKNNEERTTALVAQFRREFTNRGEEVVRRVAMIASSDAATRLALTLQSGSPDYGSYLNEAKSISETERLDFLEFIDGQGTVISSAQWPAKFGYKESLPLNSIPNGAFLKQEDLPQGAALGVFAIKEVSSGDRRLFVVGGRKLDKNFLASLELPAGMRALFYENLGPEFSPRLLFDASGWFQQADRVAPLIQQVQQQHREISTLIRWTSKPDDDETIEAIPLNGEDGQLLGVLLLGSSRRPYVELRQQIRSAALLSGGIGVLLAVGLASWAAARVTRPVEKLAHAAREVAAGNLLAAVDVQSSDEFGELAESFNRMTRELLEQRERLVQAERVAAWRELARRLAHELKNPLFPLQLTVENLLRAKQHLPAMFDEIFQESSTTMLAEIANLKAIISRFSEFSKMPQPQLQPVDINEVVQTVVGLFQAQLQAPGRAAIECKLELTSERGPIAADPELLHRALSNLVLNAMDAMPQGGALTVCTRQAGDYAYIEVSDTGNGMTPEECERIFTPYYTSKAHGTGLGLAIVQSVVSDHGGRISVRSQPGQGATFVIELPKRSGRLSGHDPSAAASNAIH
jgi:signal transduction histidine kinase